MIFIEWHLSCQSCVNVHNQLLLYVCWLINKCHLFTFYYCEGIVVGRTNGSPMIGQGWKGLSDEQ